jgi:hypothetical protein
LQGESTDEKEAGFTHIVASRDDLVWSGDRLELKNLAQALPERVAALSK